MSSQQNSGPATKKMKLEHDSSATATSPSQSTPTAATSTTVYQTTTQWNTSQIPIDPALQQQPAPTLLPYPHYQAYAQAHYPQASYAPHPHFQPYQAPPPQAPVAAQPSRQTTQPNDSDSVDITTLNDALGSAGVDLRAEEETLQRSQDHHTTYRSHEDRSRKQPSNPSFDARILGTSMREVGTRHKVPKIPEDSVNYLALALRARLQDLIKAMIAASEHRTEAQFDRPPSLYEDGTPMWNVVVRRDTKKQLEALEKAEREEEMKVRRERKERADAAAAQAAAASQISGVATADGGSDDPMEGVPAKKPKKKKDGPGVTARNMSEDVQKRLSNAVATQAAGLGRGKYAWMNAGNLASTPVKPKPAATATSLSTSPANVTSTTQLAAGTWAKPYVSSTAKTVSPSAEAPQEEKRTVNMRDAMFVIERERGHGAGRGAARGWV